MSDDNSETEYVTFFKVVLKRNKAGLGVFIAQFHTSAVEPNMIVLKLSKQHSKIEGVVAVVKTVLKELKKRGDTTYNWDTVNVNTLAEMLLPYIKSFSTNILTEQVSFITDALP